MTAQSAALRQALVDLNTLAGRDLASLLREGNAAEEALRDILPALVDTYGSAAATLTANWYDDLRAAREVRGTFHAIPADIPDTGTQALVGWATSTATNDDAFRTLILGGVQRRIANFSRGTVTGSSIADPGARGWSRVGAGECDFCSMLIGRGAVYTEATADFASHDHCHCGAAPDFG